MKKLLTMAVAAAFVAPLTASADAIMYGRVNVNLVHEDAELTVCTDGCQSASDEAWDLQNNASRIGVKGSEDLGNGLAAIFQFEFGVDASDSGDLSGRLAYAGLTGGFGTVAVGRQWTPYYGSVDKTDIMQVNNMNSHYLGLTRVGNAVAYVTPNFNGLSGKVALVIDNGGAEDTGEDFADWTNVSLDYDNGPLSIGASWLRENSGEEDLWGLAGKYNFGMFALIGQYENAEDDVTSWALGGEVYFGNNTLRAVYGDMDFGDLGDGTNWAVGVEHNFSKRTRIFAEYQDFDAEANLANESAKAELKRFGVGIRHDF